MAFKRRLRETGQIVRVNGRSIVLFEAAYRLLALPLFLRIADALMRFSLNASGYSYAGGRMPGDGVSGGGAGQADERAFDFPGGPVEDGGGGEARELALVSGRRGP